MAQPKTRTASVFETLNAINCNDKTEKKNGLTYLSWAWAWAEVKKAYPSASYTIYEAANGWNYHTDGRTCWVKTGVTIEGLEHIEYLPVMDARNRSIPADAVTSFDVNKAIQRSLTKACARHGLGLYIYAGEDLPEADQQPAPEAPAPQIDRSERQRQIFEKVADEERPTNIDPDTYWKVVEAYAKGRLSKSGEDYRTRIIAQYNLTHREIQRFDMDVDNYKVANNLK